MVLLHECAYADKAHKDLTIPSPNRRAGERFNGTLKSMFCKMADENGKDWDKLLPYILFAY